LWCTYISLDGILCHHPPFVELSRQLVTGGTFLLTTNGDKPMAKKKKKGC